MPTVKDVTHVAISHGTRELLNARKRETGAGSVEDVILTLIRERTLQQGE